MKAPPQKEKTRRPIRSFADFRKRFYPKAVDLESPESCNPEEAGEKLAQESLDQLEAALTTK